MLGKTISHYHIIEKLGGGGMGVVYKAEDTKLKRIVVLKFLPPELTRDPEAKARFIREAQAASALQHNNICTIHEIDGTDDGQMYICMDFYKGETLKKKIEVGPLKIDNAIDFAIQVTQGLMVAHEANEIHRDIKPANIMITERGEVKIVDFGLAKLAGQTRLTVQGTTFGTVAYMSPEQVRGEDVDRRSDIWSLGVVLYEMITGQLPFKGEYEQSILYAIINEQPYPPSGLRTGIPMELERIILKALNKNLAERYQHTEDFLVDLKGVQKSTSTFVTPTLPQMKSAGRSKKIVGKYILPVLAIMIIISTYFFLKPVFEKELAMATPKPVVVISFKNQTGDPQYDYLQEAIPNLLITSLEQSKFFRILSWQRMYDLLKQMGKSEITYIDQETGFEIGRLEGVEAIILGSYIKAGDIFATDVKILDVQSKQLIKSASSRGEGVGSILQSQIDDLTKEISRSASISENVIKNTRLRISEVTTASMEAYHNYLKGQDAFDKIYYEDARKYFEQAIQIDTTFAAAYLYLARVNGILNEDESRDLHYEKAKIYSQKASEKDRLYIEAYYARQIEKNPDKRLKILQQMADKYPKEKLVLYDLGLYYHSNKEYQKALNYYDQALQLDPNYGAVFNDLAYVYGDMGEFDKADEYLKKYTDALPGDANPFDSYGELYLRTGQFEKAINKYKEALEVKPDFGSEWRIAWIFSFKEDYKTALQWMDNYISRARSPMVVLRGYWWKSLFFYLSGNPGQTFSFLERCKQVKRDIKSRGIMTDLLRAWILLDQGDIKQGNESYMRVYESSIMDSPQYKANHKADLAFYRGLTYVIQSKIDSARIELNNIHQLFSELTPLGKERHRYNQDYLYTQILLAADSLEKAEKIYKAMKPLETPFKFNFNWMQYNFPFSKDGLAQAYQRHGNLDQAIAEYNKLIDQNPKIYSIRLIHPKYHYRLAKLYEQKGQTKEAIQQYTKFVTIWAQAEQNLPECIDAQNRLVQLTGELHK